MRKENVVNNKGLSSRKSFVRDLPSAVSLLNKEQQPYCMKQAEGPGQRPAGTTIFFNNGNGFTPALVIPVLAGRANAGYSAGYKSGFTLIELLVVVLIIGILAAVALPQYQKAVEKSRATQAITLLKSVYQAADAYYLANGVWPTRFDELGIDISIGASTTYTREESQSNNDWKIGVFNYGINNGGAGVWARRLSGKYKGGGFFIFKETNDFDKDVLICAETFSGGGNYYMATGDAGNYCVKLFKGTKVGGLTTSQIYYSMP